MPGVGCSAASSASPAHSRLHSPLPSIECSPVHGSLPTEPAFFWDLFDRFDFIFSKVLFFCSSVAFEQSLSVCGPLQNQHLGLRSAMSDFCLLGSARSSGPSGLALASVFRRLLPPLTFLSGVTVSSRTRQSNKDETVTPLKKVSGGKRRLKTDASADPEGPEERADPKRQTSDIAERKPKCWFCNGPHTLGDCSKATEEQKNKTFEKMKSKRPNKSQKNAGYVDGEPCTGEHSMESRGKWSRECAGDVRTSIVYPLPNLTTSARQHC